MMHKKNETCTVRKALRSWHISVAGWVWLISLLLMAQAALAQQYCIPQAFGVPALSGAPVWLDEDGDLVFPELPDEDDRLEDPRWRGAFGITHLQEPVTGDEVIFRAIQRAEGAITFLYLSWYVRVAPSLDPTLSRIYLAISPGGSNDDVFIEVDRTSAAPNAAVSDFTPTVRTRAAGAVSWDPALGTIPPWINDTRTWVTNSPQQTWAIQMRIPLETAPASINDAIALDASSPFEMWYAVRAGIDATNFVEYNWPLGQLSQSVGFSVEPPSATSDWGDFQIATLPTDPGCSNVGVSLSVANVATTNTPSSQINLVSSNTFFARPTNNTGSNIALGAIRATFRTANWGSQANWNQVSDVNTLWETIIDEFGNPAVDIPSTGGIATGTTADGTNQIEFDWTLSECQRCAYDIYYGANTATCNANCPALPAIKKRNHQCLLVELDGPFIFLNKSVYRNMDFVDASVFNRDAEISVVGIDDPIPNGGTEREVYLYVETLNMPSRVARDDQDQRGDNELPRLMHLQPTAPDTLLLPDVPLINPLDATMPTYRVHVYRDTGDRFMDNGVETARFTSQGSFGYYVSHEGALEGWRHQLEGDNLEQIGPNLYRIPVPDNGVAMVSTTIEAVEGDVTGGMPWRWIIFILLLLLLIVAIYMIKRMKSAGSP